MNAPIDWLTTTAGQGAASLLVKTSVVRPLMKVVAIHTSRKQ
jgi:hypothetical protein